MNKQSPFTRTANTDLAQNNDVTIEQGQGFLFLGELWRILAYKCMPCLSKRESPTKHSPLQQVHRTPSSTMTTNVVVTSTIFLLFVNSVSSQLQLYHAGSIGNPIRALRKNDTLCPLSYATGWTIRCIGKRGASTASFLVNGKPYRTEHREPFFINGDAENLAFPFRPLLNVTVRVECRVGEASYISDIDVSCKNGHNSKKQGGVPPKEKSSLSDEQRASGCVVIDAKNVKLSEGWSLVPSGVEFGRGDTSHNIVAAGVSVLHYKFRPRRKGRHAVVIDMTTRHPTEFNDIWLRMSPGGVRLTQWGGSERKKTDWIKAYHNENRRARLASSVDHNPHAIATGLFLQAGQRVKLDISGRSNRVTIHKFILFPCDDFDCLRGKAWLARLRLCAST